VKVLGTALTGVALTVAALALVLLVRDVLDIPAVYVRSWSGECVHVETYAEADRSKGYSCRHLPEKYDRVLVGSEYARK
jgi:hypothetical protein